MEFIAISVVLRNPDKSANNNSVKSDITLAFDFSKLTISVNAIICDEMKRCNRRESLLCMEN